MDYITLALHRGAIDPEGIGSDAELSACIDYLLDTVREAYPGIEIRTLGPGGFTAAMIGGVDKTHEVRALLNQAFSDWCASPSKLAERVL